MTNDERSKLILKRTEELKKEMKIKQEQRRRRLASAGCVAACFMIATGMGLIIPDIVDISQNSSVTYAYGTASIISGSPAAGYIILGIMSFALGALSALAAVRLYGRSDKDDRSANDGGTDHKHRK